MADVAAMVAVATIGWGHVIGSLREGSGTSRGDGHGCVGVVSLFLNRLVNIENWVMEFR